ncbi:uncharacterized protein MELLADRAFT_123772 [Melampsora larici-populina 98AG31]|uniref:Secreted protein n=1 Tax=Melampsora larici-populina (strain 98AG31 / pathotype 3-4-7) TaxID=747676 RepID=F4RDY7_MELLP|nr:uncharacterized protein MELLADRAFT_123772 [Melampsora larici-populina 98AG31]EGG09487.1 secreted protein [Melampsora larici-populina 98AG31]
MLRLLAKISLLLFPICFYGAEGQGAPDTEAICFEGFAGDGNVGVCRTAQEDATQTHLYTCPYSYCSSDGNKWVLMRGCQLIGSKDKGQSEQQCVLYCWDPVKNNWVCTNSGEDSYTCTDRAGDYIVCTRCTEVPKS